MKSIFAELTFQCSFAPSPEARPSRPSDCRNPKPLGLGGLRLPQVATVHMCTHHFIVPHTTSHSMGHTLGLGRSAPGRANGGVSAAR